MEGEYGGGRMAGRPLRSFVPCGHWAEKLLLCVLDFHSYLIDQVVSNLQGGSNPVGACVCVLAHCRSVCHLPEEAN